MRHKELTLNPELPISPDQPPTIKVIARRPSEQQAKLSARSKKKDRFNSDDFLGFYSPTHEYDSLQKGRLDLNKVFPRTPSKDLKESRESKDIQPFKQEEISCLNRTPPTKSQLRVRLKLNEISNDLQNVKSKKLQELYQTEKVGRDNVQNDQKSSREGVHIHLTSKVSAADASLIQENKKLKQENIRLGEVIARMKENLKDCHNKITKWQQGEVEKQVQIRALQLQNAEYKTENTALFKNSNAKDEMNTLLQKNLESIRQKMEVESKECQIFKKMYDQSHKKIQYLEDLVKNNLCQLQNQRQKCKYLEIQLQVLKQKKFQLQNTKSIHDQKAKLLEDVKKWRQEATRLKNKLAHKEDLFELSP